MAQNFLKIFNCEIMCDLIIVLASIYDSSDLSVSRNLFSGLEMRQFGTSGTEGLKAVLVLQIARKFQLLAWRTVKAEIRKPNSIFISKTNSILHILRLASLVKVCELGLDLEGLCIVHLLVTFLATQKFHSPMHNIWERIFGILNL